MINWWDSRRGRRSLPTGRHLALTWTIPPDFGGVTNVLLRRSAQFAELWDIDVDVLTFYPLEDWFRTHDSLQSRGLLHPRVHLRSLWRDLAGLEDAILGRFAFDRTDFQVTQPPLGPSRTLMTNVDVATRVVGHGLEQRQYQIHRPDGSILARLDWVGNYAKAAAANRWGDHALKTTIFDHDECPVGTWKGIFPLHHEWLDLLIGDDPACVIADAAPVGDFLAHYRRPNVTTVTVMHGAHLKRRREPPYAGLSDWRKFSVENRSRFDATVFLTARQRTDAARLLGPDSRSHVVGNSSPPLDRSDLPRRHRGHGVAVARLAVGKRLELAIRAAHLAHATEREVRLHLHGSGEAEQQLADVVRELGASSHVTMEGYSQDTSAVFASASFSLMTSVTEGFGLVVIESMAAGCIPIAYDVPYGPADIITHGVDGFLVPSGDVDALARQIIELLEMDESAVRAMRSAAMERASDFSPTAITRRWATVLREAQRDRAPIDRPDREAIARQEEIAGRIRCESATLGGSLEHATWRAGVLRCEVQLSLALHGDASGWAPSASLIRVATGSRTALRARPTGPTTTDDRGRVQLVLEIDTSELLEIASPASLVMVGVERDGVRYEDTIRSRPAWGPLAPLPLDTAGTPGRITCHLEPGWGLVLRRPSPTVTMTGVVDDHHVSIDVSHRSQEEIRDVTLTSRLTHEVLHGEQTGASRWSFSFETGDEPLEHQWDLRAQSSSGKNHKVAWARDEASLVQVSPRLAPVRFETTTYGYVSISTQDARLHVTDLHVTDGVLTVHTQATPGPTALEPVLVNDDVDGRDIVRADSRAGPDTSRRSVFTTSALTPGSWHLRAATADLAHLVAAPATDDAQRLLPLSTEEGAVVATTRSGSVRVTPPS